MKDLYERFLAWCGGYSMSNKIVGEKVTIPDYPLMLKQSSNGKLVNLGREVFVYRPGKGCAGFHEELNGKMVCKIAGVDDSAVPGYHTSDGWVTVCPIDADRAMWHGVLASELEQIN